MIYKSFGRPCVEIYAKKVIYFTEQNFNVGQCKGI